MTREEAMKPTEKQIKYIRDLQTTRYNVPEFTGTTIKDASVFIAKYKSHPYVIDDDSREMLIGIEGFEYFA